MQKKLTFNQTDLQQISNNFLNILSTTSFSQTVLPKVSFISNQNNNQPFQAMVMGGTYFQSGIFQVQNSDLVCIYRTQKTMPIIIDKAELGALFLSHLNKNVDKIVLNFTFPIQNFERKSRLDAKLIKGTKGYKFNGLIGENVGEFLEKYTLQILGKNIEIMVVNDTIPLLVGDTKTDQKANTVAGIVGTGLNLAFWKGADTIVVTEPETHIFYPILFEDQKEISGSYLYQIYNRLTNNNLKNTEQLGDLALAENQTAVELFQRSASTFASMIAGLFAYLDFDHIHLIMEGSLFWNGHNYQQHFWDTLQTFNLDKNKIRLTKNSDSLTSTARIGLV